jgi:hypothetical protein
VPLIRIIKSNDEIQIKKIPAILRSAFNYEVFNVIRKQYRGKDGESKAMLHKLLGIDIEKHKVKVELPMDEENVKLYDKINLNLKYLKSFVENLEFACSIALIPKFFEAVIQNRLDDIPKISKIDEKFVLEVLDMKDCEFKDFMFMNVYQALRYTTKQERCDTEKKTMKILDIKNYIEGKEDIQNYIRGVFKAEFRRDILYAKGMDARNEHLLKNSYFFEEKLRMELNRPKKYSYDTHADNLVMKILSTSSYDEMINTWKEGITINDRSFRVSTCGSLATRLFVLALRCVHLNIPLRFEIFQILSTGKDKNGNVIWKNDSLKEGTRNVRYMELVNTCCYKYPSEFKKDVEKCR